MRVCIQAAPSDAFALTGGAEDITAAFDLSVHIAIPVTRSIVPVARPPANAEPLVAAFPRPKATALRGTDASSY